jgi:transcriptional regulator with PAS, ATPase and Fis domain
MIINAINIKVKTENTAWIDHIYDSFQPNHIQELLILDLDLTAYIFFISVIEKESKTAISNLLNQHISNNQFEILEHISQVAALNLFLDLSSGKKNSEKSIADTLSWLKERFNIAMNKNATGPILGKIYRTALDFTQMIYDHPEMESLSTSPAEALYDISRKISEDIKDFQVIVCGKNKTHLLEIGQIFRKHSIRKIFHFNNTFVDSYESTFSSSYIPIDESSLATMLTTRSIIINLDMENDWLWKRIYQPILENKNVLFIYFQYDNAAVPKTVNKLANVFVQKYDHIKGIIDLYQQKRSELLAAFDDERHSEIDKFNEWLHSEKRFQFSGIVSRDREMQKIFELIRRISQVDINVLINGQTGTGKELVARAIHNNSKRKNNKFIPVNCSAIPETLLEAELFGYEKGAFTGAISQKRGLVELASGGTLFLDEIGDIPPAIQVKLLRVLQEREILRLGNTDPIKVDVRLVAATNRDLQSLIDEGKFRTDLYFRVNTVQIHLPNLSERPEDIPLLTSHFIEKMNQMHNKSTLDVTEEVKHKLQNYNWPGNIRELENVIEHSVAISVGNRITLTDLPEQIQSDIVATGDINYSGTNLKDREAVHIKTLLEEQNHNYSQVAKLLGISRTTLWRKLKEYNLSRENR